MKEETSTHLLTMYEDVHASAQPLVDPADGGLQVGLEVCGGAVEDVEAVALEFDTLLSMGIDTWKPWRVEDLDEGADVVGGEQRGVKNSRERSKVQCAGVIGRRGWQNKVHRCAHRLHDLWWQIVEADHCKVEVE